MKNNKDNLRNIHKNKRSLIDSKIKQEWDNQIIANLLDNSISFSDDGSEVIVNVSNGLEKKVIVKILDEGQGFKEKDTSKIFNRFYSNRPENFGEHSGLGLNIVKNLVELHDGKIEASNRLDKQGALIEIKFPSL